MLATNAPIEHVYHALRISIAFVRYMRRASVDHCLVNGVRRLVWKNARGQARDELLYSKLAARLEYVVIHCVGTKAAFEAPTPQTAARDLLNVLCR